MLILNCEFHLHGANLDQIFLTDCWMLSRYHFAVLWHKAWQRPLIILLVKEVFLL